MILWVSWELLVREDKDGKERAVRNSLRVLQPSSVTRPETLRGASHADWSSPHRFIPGSSFCAHNRLYPLGVRGNESTETVSHRSA